MGAIVRVARLIIRSDTTDDLDVGCSRVADSTESTRRTNLPAIDCSARAKPPLILINDLRVAPGCLLTPSTWTPIETFVSKAYKHHCIAGVVGWTLAADNTRKLEIITWRAFDLNDVETSCRWVDKCILSVENFNVQIGFFPVYNPQSRFLPRLNCHHLTVTSAQLPTRRDGDFEIRREWHQRSL